MGATGSLLGDLAHAVGASACGCGCRSGLFLLGAQLVNELDEQEDAQSYQEEVNDGLNESAVLENNVSFTLYCCLGDKDSHICKVYALGQGGEDGHEHIVYQRRNDGGECGADHHADCQVDYVALEGEGLELFPEFHGNNLFLSIITSL